MEKATAGKSISRLRKHLTLRTSISVSSAGRNGGFIDRRKWRQRISLIEILKEKLLFKEFVNYLWHKANIIQLTFPNDKSSPTKFFEFYKALFVSF